MKKLNSNRLVTERVNLTFNEKQLKIIDNLVGEGGDNRADVVKTIFLNYLSEKNIIPDLLRKKLQINNHRQKL